MKQKLEIVLVLMIRQSVGVYCMTYGPPFLKRPFASRRRTTLTARAMLLRAGSRCWCGFVDFRSYGDAGCLWRGAVRVALKATTTCCDESDVVEMFLLWRVCC